MIRALLLVLALVGPAWATDEPFLSEVWPTEAPVTADGDVDIKHRANVLVQVDFSAGAGTVAFTCRAHPSAPFLAFPTPPTTCTADCLRAMPLNCETVRASVTGCAACEIRVYTWATEARN